MSQPNRPDIDPRPIPEIVPQPHPAQPQPVEPFPGHPAEVPTPDQPVEDPMPSPAPEIPADPDHEPRPREV